jgi:ADP-ribosylation factor family
MNCMRFWNAPELKGIPVLIYANKQELPLAMKPGGLVCWLCLKEGKWYITGVRAKSQDDLDKGMYCLFENV